MSESIPASKAEVENLYRRVAALEETVKDLAPADAGKPAPWWRREVGRFANDPIWEEILRLGREYRESTREASDGEEGSERSSSIRI